MWAESQPGTLGKPCLIEVSLTVERAIVHRISADFTALRVYSIISRLRDVQLIKKETLSEKEFASHPDLRSPGILRCLAIMVHNLLIASFVLMSVRHFNPSLRACVHCLGHSSGPSRYKISVGINVPCSDPQR